MIAELALETRFTQRQLLEDFSQEALNELIEVIDQRNKSIESERKIAEMKARLPK